ncbi:MAG: hypothetical protein LW817_08085 [Candidatus Caenarcaniphilales bacterium]|jgi:hypothetical protein|nr:hypothetical protein [Candidatus Caenarcaniphilales bacterium]
MSKNFLASKNQDLDNFDKKSKREENAWYLIESIKRSKSNWIKSEFVKNLSLYLDLDFVKQELIVIYKSTNSIELRQTIKALHDGTLDLSEFMKELEENTRLFQEAKLHRKEVEEYVNEYHLSESPLRVSGEIDSQSLGILKLKAQDRARFNN